VTRRSVGWTFVLVQFLLLGALIALPSRNDWSTPWWTTTLGGAVVIGGLGIVGFASLNLGRALTATPVPTKHGELVTTGLYRFTRHPIYSAVLLIVIGLVVRSGSLLHALVGAVTMLFFNRKARWEEAQLADRYPGYEAYAATTPRFVPSLLRIRRT